MWYELYEFRKDSTRNARLMFNAYMSNEKVEITSTGFVEKNLVKSSYSQKYTSDEIDQIAYDALNPLLKEIEGWMSE